MTTEQLSALLDTAAVIDMFYDASYDDLGVSRTVWQTVHGYMVNNFYNKMTVTDYKKVSLETVIADLELLLNKITEDLGDPDIGYRHGYFNSIRYILFRWYTINAPVTPYDYNNIPSWYIQCTEMINTVPRRNECPFVSSIELTEQMLEITKAYRDACS